MSSYLCCTAPIPRMVFPTPAISPPQSPRVRCAKDAWPLSMGLSQPRLAAAPGSARLGGNSISTTQCDAMGRVSGQHENGTATVGQMPSVAGPRTMRTNPLSVGSPKFQAPLTDGFVANHNAALGHHIFDIAKTQAESRVHHRQWLMMSAGKR
jgi:hypothetical protein